MNTNYISLNFPNTVSVFIMATLGYCVVSSAISFVKSKVAG